MSKRKTLTGDNITGIRNAIIGGVAQRVSADTETGGKSRCWLRRMRFGVHRPATEVEEIAPGAMSTSPRTITQGGEEVSAVYNS